MDQNLSIDLFKEMAIGYKTAKSYPPSHPVMDKVVKSTRAQLARVYAEVPEFSMYFLEKTVIFQDLRIDVSKNLAMLALLEALRKNDINSLTFEAGVSENDIRNLYEVIGSSKLKIREFGDAPTMLSAKGTANIKINAVKFGIQTSTATQVAQEYTEEAKEHDIVMESIFRNLKEIVKKGLSVIETKTKFVEALTRIEKEPQESWQAYSQDMAQVVEQMPLDHRTALLKDIEFKPFVLKMLSNLSEETLVNLIFTQVSADKGDELKKVINVIDEEKFSNIMPDLKEKVPEIYEYLARLGLMLSERVSSTVAKDDLRIAMKPYYSMLDSDNAPLRAEGLKSLINLADRFIQKNDFELAEEIIFRIATAMEHESVGEVIGRSVDDLARLYQSCKKNNKQNFCSTLLDPFSKVLGHGGLSLDFQRRIIKFLSETGNSIVLPMLFSFLWETGIYPEVREAITKFGKDAVNEALLTLKEAEDADLRRKLVDIMRNIGHEGIDVLVKNLDVNEWFLRRNIVAVLGDIGDKSVIDNLIVVLQDKDDRVRLELTKTFVKLEHTEGLLQALTDPSTEVKTEALKGLRDKIDKEKIVELIPMLKQKGDDLHLELLRMIGEKKINEAVDTLVEFLQIMEARKDIKANELKELAIAVLLKLNPENIKIVLENFVDSRNKQLAQFAKTALKKIT